MGLRDWFIVSPSDFAPLTKRLISRDAVLCCALLRAGGTRGFVCVCVCVSVCCVWILMHTCPCVVP